MRPNKLLFVLAAIVLLSSCKKDYVCSCFAAGEDDPTLFQLKDMKQSKAEQLCKAYETYPGRACQLK